MKIITTGLAAATVLAVAATPAMANPHWPVKDRPTFQDTVRITGNVDSGSHGYWADVTMTRTITVTETGKSKNKRVSFKKWDRKRKKWVTQWKWAKNTGPQTYKVKISDKGTFKSFKDAKSPGAGKPLTSQVKGTFTGGMEFTVTATSKPTDRQVRSWYHYRCDKTGNCPGRPTSTSTWPTLYFKNATVKAGDWGWTYKAPCSTWVNSSKGNKGDILPCPIHTTPKAPVLKNATCKSPATVTARKTKGVVYKIKDTVLEHGKPTPLATGKHLVIAEPEDGYTFRRFTTTRWTVDGTAPKWCPKVTQTPAPSPTASPSATETPAEEAA